MFVLILVLYSLFALCLRGMFLRKLTCLRSTTRPNTWDKWILIAYDELWFLFCLFHMQWRERIFKQVFFLCKIYERFDTINKKKIPNGRRRQNSKHFFFQCGLGKRLLLWQHVWKDYGLFHSCARWMAWKWMNIVNFLELICDVRANMTSFSCQSSIYSLADIIRLHIVLFSLCVSFRTARWCSIP